MMRSHSHPYQPHQRGSRGPNLVALAVACAALGFAYLNSDPALSGADPVLRTASIAGPPVLSLPPTVPTPASAEPTDAPTAEPLAEAASSATVLRGQWAMLVNVLMLKQGCAVFERISDYTCTLYKQERIGGELGDGQTCSVKMRHEPFSVYMKWIGGSDKGQQLIYVEGQNDNNMLVQPGGIKGRLTGVLSLDTHGSLAMSKSRHPIQQAGLLEMARTILRYREADLARGQGYECEMHSDQTFNDRPAYLFITIYDAPEFNQDYRKSILYVDKELAMPVCVQNFTWAKDADPEKLDEQTLIEFYSYSDIKMDQRLGETDFDKTNGDYKLRVR